MEDDGRCGKWRKRKTGEEMNTMAKSCKIPLFQFLLIHFPKHSSLEWMFFWWMCFLFEEMRSDSETPGHLTF
jgi:hypothetical protein